MNKLFKPALVGMFAMLSSAMPAVADYCGDNCCPPAACYDSCDCCDRFWGSAEYLYWKIQDAPEPVCLVTEGPYSEPLLDGPDSICVLGGKKIKNDWVSGGRFGLGAWLDDCHCFGAEVSYFILPYQSKKHCVFNPGTVDSGYLAVPYFDTNAKQEAAEDIAGFFGYEGSFSGKAELRLRNRMQGAEINGIWAVPTCDCNFKVGLLGGFRWWNFDETLTFKTSSPFLDIPTDVYKTEDKFSTQNNFYGGQIGIGVDYSCDCFFLNLKGKLALGANCAKTDIHGDLCTNDYNEVEGVGQPQNYVGGFFAQSSNIGSHKKTYFAVIPEVEATIGYQITECLRFKVGYNFLWVNKVLRPGKQFDRNIDPTQSVTFEGPEINLNSSDYPKANLRTNSIWAQGLNVGFDFAF